MLVWYEARSFDVILDGTPIRACPMRAHVSEKGREIASVSTQVHVGIGWTDEQNLHFWLRRLTNARHLLGGIGQVRECTAELVGQIPAA